TEQEITTRASQSQEDLFLTYNTTVSHLFLTLPEAMISIKKHDIEHIISQKSGDSSFLPANVFYNPPILIRGYLIWASKIVYS
ncbi:MULTISPECIES: hypothetical protein, partial [Escherichia]